jgi:predicted enzyme related to lactoylglutathione lyase
MEIEALFLNKTISVCLLKNIGKEDKTLIKQISTVRSELKPSIVFEVDDIEKTYEQLRDNGVDVEEPKQMKFGKFATFKDLDGNQFGLKG